MNIKHAIAALAALLALSPRPGAAQTISEDFTGTSTQNSWVFRNGACLTASTTVTTSPGSPPGCTTILSSYYEVIHGNANDRQPSTALDTKLTGGYNGTFPDPVGNGALRFTNGCAGNCATGNTTQTVANQSGKFENGSIVSATTFPMFNGLQVTFKTVTYGGNTYGGGTYGGNTYTGDGADGISFFLIDGGLSLTDPTYNGIGALGGAFSYQCSNNNGPVYDGLVGGYIGIGIDEYGNFLNASDNTATGYGFNPNRIGMRGRGSVSWNYLNAKYPSYYPSSVLNSQALQQAAVSKTCSTGTLWNYSASASNPTQVTGAVTPTFYDYAPITTGTGAGAYALLPPSTLIANETTTTRPTGLTTNGVTNGNVFIYSMKITQTGLLSFSYSVNGGAYQPVINNQNIISQNGTVPNTVRFGFAGSTGGGTNVHEIMCFQAGPANQSASSAGGDQKQTAEVQTTTQDYFAYYDPSDWTGRVTAYGLSDSSGVLTLNSLAAWDAQCVLTGVTSCVNTGASGPTSPEAPTSRVMLTYNGTNASTATAGTAGTPFEWPSATAGITTAEENKLDAGDTTPINANRLSYLRGVRSLEINPTTGLPAGGFRARDGVLGDIIDSSPAWVGPPSAPYGLTWKDRLYPTTTMAENSGTTTYPSFQSTNQSRLNVVYVGANDGFLHGFEAGTEDINGDVNSTQNDGKEVLAYMPGAVLNTIHNATQAGLDYANPLYAHNFYVDATPGSGDVYYGAAWHTWLVGGLGAGGAAIYALDITNPANFAESNATALVKGEWSSATISCTGNTACGVNLGNTYGTPQIRRFHNGTWGAVFGNGYGSASGDAGIFVMTIDPTTGTVTNFYYLSTGQGTGTTASPCTTGCDGIAYVTPADLDGDHITDYVYAGDLKGNVWRFDLTSATATNWAVTTGGPLFKTAGATQPITTQLVLASSLVSGTSPQVMVAFGTGQRTQFTNTSSASYITNTQQAVYGVWDWNLSAWNAESPAQYASLTTAEFTTATGISGSPYSLTSGNLQVQTLTTNTAAGTVTTSNTPVVFEQCTAANACTAGKFGWYAVLPGSNGTLAGTTATTEEQLVSNPSLYQSALIFNSTIPANNSPLSCASPTTDSGVLYALSATTGGTFVGGGGSTTGASSSAFSNHVNTQVVGLATNETGTMSVATTKEGTTWLVGQNIQTTPGQAPGQTTQIQLPKNISVNRVTWVELR
jgi:type IV pilus assembly protein PilY1